MNRVWWVLLGMVVVLRSTAVHAEDAPRLRSRTAGEASSIIRVTPSTPPGVERRKAAASPSGRVVEISKVPLAATVLRRGQVAQDVDLTVKPVELKAGELLLTKSSAVAVQQPATAAIRSEAARWVLPYEFRFASAEGPIRLARLVAEVAAGGLRMSPTAPGFSGQVFLALEDQQDRTRTYALPVPAHVLVTAPVDTVTPSSFAVETTNKWVAVGLTAINPANEFKAKIRASTDPDGLEIDIRVIRPTLTVTVTPDHIQGLGLELATVNIIAAGVPNPQGRTITLTATKGSLTNTQVQLTDQGTAHAEIRSIAVGGTMIEAISPPLDKG